MKGLLLVSYLFPGARRCQRLQPLASRVVRDDTNASDQLRIPSLTLDSDCTDHLNLPSSFSYHVVSFRLHTYSTGRPRHTVIPLFTNHNVTACQSTRSYQERTQNPCQSLYNIRYEITEGIHIPSRSIVDLNSKFSFFQTNCYTKFKEPTLLSELCKAGMKIVGLKLFPRV